VEISAKFVEYVARKRVKLDHNQYEKVYVPEHRKVPHAGRGRAASGGFCAQTQLGKPDFGHSGADVRGQSEALPQIW